MSCKSVESRVNLSPGTYVVTDSWPQAPLRPTTSTGTPSSYGVDPQKLKHPDPQVTWNMCSQSPPPPPGFAAISANRVAQPLPGFGAFKRSEVEYQLNEEAQTPGFQLSSPFVGEHAVEDLSPSWYQNSNNANREYPPFRYNSGAEAYERFRGERLPPDSDVSNRDTFCQNVDGNRGPLNFVKEQNEKSDIQSLIKAMHAMTSQINRRNAPPLSKEDLFSGNPLTYRRFVTLSTTEC